MTKPRPAIDRALARLETSDPDACWVWPGSTAPGGYGQIEETPAGGKRRAVLVHRLVYEHFVGPVPEGHDLHHTCHRRACANFRHVVPIGHVEHGREHKPRTESCTSCGISDWYDLPDGRRACRECRRLRRREARANAGHQFGRVYKLDADGVREIRRLRSEGMLLKEIAQRVGVSKSAVHTVTSGKAWAHVE